MARQSSFNYEELLACGRGELFGPGNAQLPLPPMLMFDRITSIGEDGGAYGKGHVRGRARRAAGPLVLPLPFQGRSGDAGLPRRRRPVADGRLLPRLVAAPRAAAGRSASARSSSPIRFCRPYKKVVYGVDLKRVFRSKLVLGIADGWLEADGRGSTRARICGSACSRPRAGAAAEGQPGPSPFRPHLPGLKRLRMTTQPTLR